ncbi:Terminal uridylyltransferase 7 isoform 2 [Schistosoma japonicum]|uniref:Terminal uridylyltransferase 7 isoform 2 n=2 Tax=Schistosoma japonicum TaxID=6182 RepID=A0A4Z2D979_SCHJA|nr:Terminal uridylyltransferase 7 [Schistosoma japonicum]TNN13034.1 Terminal uridylyltransferase 7 isoform 2 [Schistosoma japonicum]
MTFNTGKSAKFREAYNIHELPSEKLEYLNKNYIRPYRKKFRSGLLCQVCGTIMSTVGAAMVHISSTSHNANIMTAELKTTLLYLPPITDSHRIALDSVLQCAIHSVVIDVNEVQRRRNFANDLIAAIEARIPNIKVRGTGSLWFGLALPDSHCSLDAICASNFDENDLPPMHPTINDDFDGDVDEEENGEQQPSSESVFNQSTNNDEHKLSIGYVLSDIFELLQLNAYESPCTKSLQAKTTVDKSLCNSADDNVNANESLDKPEFPQFHSVLRTSTDYFYLSLTDFFGVNYRISTGYPHGYDLAKLIDTYLSVNDQARKLAILFRKLARLGHLDMPESGTFEETVIPLLVIFYLQHCKPALLPNLHTLYRQHYNMISEDSYHQVLLSNADCSFITDIELVRKLCPHEPFTDPSLFSNLPCLADLWLGFLRFYLFDFKISSCMIDIMHPEPVKSCINGKRYFAVIDPFNPKHNLCSNVTRVSRDYINSQLLAAYGYFGVPRLASNGRHVFTQISIAEETLTESLHVSDESDPSRNTTTISNDKTTTAKVLHLTPMIDDSDNFSSNLDKVIYLVTEKFQSISSTTVIHDIVQSSVAGDTIKNSSNNSLKKSLSNSNSEQKTLSFSKMLPHILTYVMNELFESNIISDLVNECLKIPEKKFFAPLSSSNELTLNNFIEITRNFAYTYWLSFFETSISKGKFSVLKRIITRTTSSLFHKSVQSWLNRLKIQGNSDDVSSYSVHNQSQETDCSIENVREDLNDHQMYSAEIVQDFNSFVKDSEDDYPEDIITQISTNFDEGDHLLDVNNSDDAFMADSEVFLYDTLEGDCNNDFLLEEVECVPDLQDNDINDNLFSPDITYSSVAVENPKSSKSSNFQRTAENNVEDPLSVNRPSTSSTPNKLIAASNEIIKPCDNDVISPPKKSHKTAKKRQGNANISSVSDNTNACKSNFSDAQQKATKKLKWEDVITSRSAIAPAVDDDRPDFYNSIVLNDLKPEDFDFRFVLHGHLSSKGHHNQSSVLGLASRNQPSTLLAHFEAPQPQCQACKLTGHRQSQCQTPNDKSVSFSAWRKLINKTPWPPSAKQIKDISYCLRRLEEHNETDNKVKAREELVEKIRQCFSLRFPSVQLELFGSCANGFDLQSSDLDVCVFFPSGSPEWNDLKKESTVISLIKKFRKQLSNCTNRLNIVKIQPILTARVPILKVSFSNSFEADISFSNYLALSNTRMLALYTKIQPKLRTLGIALKTVTKITKIGQAAAGGISSYACIIMLIHYLQQIDQLPVLQELHEESAKPINLVNGWNVWYQDDLSVIDRLWKPANPEQSVGDMWLGFFRYYLFEFDHDTYVVTIRQKKLLVRFVKMWRSLFAVEDPFNLNHNLTAGLRHSMLLYTLNIFHTVLVHHTTFLPKQMSMDQWCYQLFSPEYIVVDTSCLRGDTLCFICNRPGHWASQCSKNKNKKSKHNDDIVVVNSLIGHFLSTTQTSNKSSIDQCDNSYQNRQLDLNCIASRNFEKHYNTSTNIPSQTYRNPFKPQYNRHSQPVQKNTFQQPVVALSNYHYEQPHHMANTICANSNFMHSSVLYPPPLLQNNTVAFMPKCGLLSNGLLNYPQFNTYFQHQQLFYPYSHHSSPNNTSGSISHGQQTGIVLHANSPLNCQPHKRQNNNENNNTKHHKFNRISSSSVSQEEFSSTSSNKKTVTSSYKAEYNKNNNTPSSHQTTTVPQTSCNHGSESYIPKNTKCDNYVANCDSAFESTCSPFSRMKNTTASDRRNQNNSIYPLKPKSNIKQSPQKKKFPKYNDESLNSQTQSPFKSNSGSKSNRNSTNTRDSLQSTTDHNLIDRNLSERLHSMFTSSSSSQRNSNKRQYNHFSSNS